MIPYYTVLLQTTTPYYKALLRTTKYYTILLRTTQCYSVLQSTTQYYSVLQSTTQYYFVLHSTTKYCTVLLRTGLRGLRGLAGSTGPRGLPRAPPTGPIPARARGPGPLEDPTPRKCTTPHCKVLRLPRENGTLASDTLPKYCACHAKRENDLPSCDFEAPKRAFRSRPPPLFIF